MKTVRRGQAVVVQMATEDFSDPPHVEAAFEEVVDLLNLRNVVVDMGEVTSLNSIGLSTITAGADFARSHNARFALAGVRPEIKRLLEQLGMVGRADEGPNSLKLADDVESALEMVDTSESDEGKRES